MGNLQREAMCNGLEAKKKGARKHGVMDGCTYQSPPESARDELALFPAAAEAKVGAIVRIRG